MPDAAEAETEPADGFMPDWAAPEMAVQKTEPADGFMPDWGMPESSAQAAAPAGGFISGWDMPQVAAAEPGMAGNIRQPDGMEIFAEDTAPTKIYEPKHHRAESRQVFSEPVQTEKAGNDWMIYG